MSHSSFSVEKAHPFEHGNMETYIHPCEVGPIGLRDYVVRRSDDATCVSMSTLLPTMVSLVPNSTVDRLVCRLAKRAGICRHTVQMIDAVWRHIVTRFAYVLMKMSIELHYIAKCEMEEEDALQGPIEYEEDAAAIHDVGDDDLDEEEDEDYDECEVDGDEDDDEHNIEHGDDADARWDEANREWVLLPSADMVGELYGLQVFGTRRCDRRNRRLPTFR